jgi:hypothetical protein
MKTIKMLKNKGVDIEWLCIKIPLIYIWILVFRDSLRDGYSVPLPIGICKLINCVFFVDGFGLVLISAIALLLSTAYLFDFKMKWVTLGLFCVSVIIFTSEESSGILKRNGTFSYLFLAQAFAYWINKSNFVKLRYFRIQYSIQAVTVGYFLSGLSKLFDTRITWPLDGVRITLQVLKSFHYKYYTTLDLNQLIKANEFVQFLTKSQNSLVIVLSATLVLELFALTAAINKGIARIYGFGLLFMHIGIYYFMDVLITSFAFPMVIVLINPFFLAVLLYNKMSNRTNLSSRIN